jgi:hypothetical protein
MTKDGKFETFITRVNFVYTIREKLEKLGFYQPYQYDALIELNNTLLEFVRNGHTISKRISFPEAKKIIEVMLSPYVSVESHVIFKKL